MKTLTKKNPITKITNKVAAAITLVQLTMMTGLCDDPAPGGATATSSAAANSAMSKLVGVICTFAKYAGIGILVLGIVKFAMALKDENGPAQSQAILYAISGAILIGIDVIINSLGLI